MSKKVYKKNPPKKIEADKFAYGGTAMNIDNPSEDLAQFQNIAQQAMIGAMSDPTVAGLKGIGNMMINTGMSMASQGMAKSGGGSSGFGQFLSKNMGSINSLVGAAQTATTYATGGVAGKVPINAEGGEVIDFPFGMPVELSGPSHANGGMDLNVPQGTEIYSKRLKGEDGKSMADRKKKREKELSRVKKLLEQDPSNPTLKKTLAKMQSNNDFVDEKDVAQMQFVKDLVEGSNRQSESFATGGYAGGFPIDPSVVNYILGQTQVPNISLEDNRTAEEKYLYPTISAGLKTTPTQNSEEGIVDLTFGDSTSDNNYYFNKETGSNASMGKYTEVDSNDNPINSTNKESSFSNLLGGTTLGDMIGMGANLLGPIAQMNNIKKNRAATPTEVNHYKNYGDEALKKIQSQYQYLDDVKNEQLGDAELSRQGTINRNNNSARGINTQRALNLVTDSQINELKSNIYNQFAAQTMSIIGQEASQMDRNDQMRMSGEERRAEKELQNTDNFYSQLSKGISDMYAGVGKTGKSLNDIKTRNVTQKNIEEQLDLLKNSTDGELILDKILSARYGITPEELKQIRESKNKKS